MLLKRMIYERNQQNPFNRTLPELSGERKEKEEFHKHVNNMHIYEN